MSSSQRKNRTKVNEAIFEQIKRLYMYRTKAELRESTGISKSALSSAI